MSRFDYIQYDGIASKTQLMFKDLFEKVEDLALTALPESRERSLLITGLEQAYMWTGKAIRNDQIKRASGLPVGGKAKGVA